MEIGGNPGPQEKGQKHQEVFQEWPALLELFQWYKEANKEQQEAVNNFVKAIINLDENTREAFIDILGKKRYGAFSFVFKAGECIGFDWKSSHRTHKT